MDSNELVWVVARLLVALPLVLFLAFLLIKFGLSKRYTAGGGGDSRMRLVEQLPLGAKATLSLVALGDKHYLLAHQENGVQLIKELDQLPGPAKGVTGDVVELIPRSVLEIDREKDAAQDPLAGEGFSPRSMGVIGATAPKGKLFLYPRSVGFAKLLRRVFVAMQGGKTQ